MVRQLGVRLLHGVLRFFVVLTAFVLLSMIPALTVFSFVIMLLAVLVMGPHMGISEPSAEVKRHL